MGVIRKYLSFVLFGVAMLLEIIAIAIPYWTVTGNVNWGLWKVCTDGKCISVTDTEEVKKMRGLHMGALVGGFITVIIYLLTEFVDCLSPKMRKRLVVAFLIKTGVFIMIADSYMANHLKLYPACHVLSLIAAGLFIFVGGLLTSPTTTDDM